MSLVIKYGNLYEKITTLENIELAHKMARKDKSFYTEVKMVDANPEYYFKQIQDMLINKTYRVNQNDYTMFEKIDKGKLREIYKLDYFPHRIIQWCIMLQTQHIFLSTFIDNTFSSIPKRGIHLAFNKLDDVINKDVDRIETVYCLKMDVKKFYPSIDQEIMKKQLRWKFKDNDLLWLMDTIIDSMDSGIATGSLFSQWLGNFALTPFDHWIKENKKVKHYFRYADDIVILHHDKKFLHQLRKDIEDYLSTNLNLTLKENWQVFPTYVRGVDFVGYRHFGDYILLRKSTATNLKRKMRRILKKCQKGKSMNHNEWSSINSYKGWIMHCNGLNLTKKYIEPLIPYADHYYNRKVKKIINEQLLIIEIAP